MKKINLREDQIILVSNGMDKKSAAEIAKRTNRLVIVLAKGQTLRTISKSFAKIILEKIK